MKIHNWFQLSKAQIGNQSKAKLTVKVFLNLTTLYHKFHKGENLETIMIVDYDKIKKAQTKIFKCQILIHNNNKNKD